MLGLSVEISDILRVAITPLAVCIFTPLIMWGIIAWYKKVVKKQNAKIDGPTFTVKYNSLVIGLNIFLIVFMAVATVLFPILYLCDIPDGPPLDVTIAATCVFGAFTALSVVLLVVIKRWKIEVRDEGVSIVPMFGKCREYRWEDFSHVKNYEAYGNVSYKVYLKANNKKAFAFSTLMVGGQMLEEKLRENGLPCSYFLN